MNKLLVLTDYDADGFTAAWVAHKFSTHEVTYKFLRRHFAPDVAGHDVLMTDFSYSREIIEKLHSEAKSFQLIDHHLSAQVALAGLDYCLIDCSKSACLLTYEYFGSPDPVPLLVQYVNDADLYLLQCEYAKEIRAFIKSFDYTLENWDYLHNALCNDFNNVVAQGAAIVNWQNKHITSVVRNSKLSLFVDVRDKCCYEVPVVNSGFLISDICDYAIKFYNSEFAVCWFESNNGYVYSLRSRGDFDVSKLATAYGGGGHKNAAGFVSPVLLHHKR